MAYVQNYYDLDKRCFTTVIGPNCIAVSAYVLNRMREDQMVNKPVQCDPNGTPIDIVNLLTLGGMRGAWLDELREQRAPVLNALNGVWIDAHTAGDTALQASVVDARNFLKNITADVDLLAVQPGTQATQGLEYMRQLTLAKYKAYVVNAPVEVRNAFKEFL